MIARPKDPTAEVVKNLFLVQRAGNSMNADVQKRVGELFDEIAALIAKIDPGGPSLQRYRIQRAQKLFAEVRALTGQTFEAITKQLRVQLAAFGQDQTDAATLHLQAVLGAEGAGGVEVVKATLNQMKAIVDSEPMQGAVLKDWFRKQGADTSFRVQRQIQLGMANAETIGQMVERVRGRPAANGRMIGGVLNGTAREAEAIVRTAVNHMSNAAAELTFKQNTDILSGVEWVAALDGRTCLQCAPLDGRTWKLDDTSRPRPPLHMGDRCILAPVPDWSLLGLEPPPSGTRATKIDPKTGKPGQVSSDVHYEEWLKAQSEALQNEILGPGRAKLFRDGKVTLRELVRTDGRRVPLSEFPGTSPKHTPAVVRLEAPDLVSGRAVPKPPQSAGTEVKPLHVPDIIGPEFTNSDDAWGYRNKAVREHGDNPEFQHFVGALDRWTDGPKQRRFHSVLEAAARGEGDDPEAISLLRAVAEGSAPAPELYRGISLAETQADVFRRYKKGVEFDINLSSFTSERYVANVFARAENMDRPLEVVYTLREGGAALRIENFARELWNEREWIANGRYRVIETRKVGKNRVEITIEQVRLHAAP